MTKRKPSPARRSREPISYIGRYSGFEITVDEPMATPDPNIMKRYIEQWSRDMARDMDRQIMKAYGIDEKFLRDRDMDRRMYEMQLKAQIELAHLSAVPPVLVKRDGTMHLMTNRQEGKSEGLTVEKLIAAQRALEANDPPKHWPEYVYWSDPKEVYGRSPAMAALPDLIAVGHNQWRDVMNASTTAIRIERVKNGWVIRPDRTDGGRFIDPSSGSLDSIEVAETPARLGELIDAWAKPQHAQQKRLEKARKAKK